MKATKHEREMVLAYLETQTQDDPVVHVEKVATERIGVIVHDIWDVHCSKSRWWVVTEPMNVYPQADFKSREVVLTFHVRLMARIFAREEIPLTKNAAMILPNSWRVWELAVEAMTNSREAEDFQAVGVRLRECMVTFASEIADADLVPKGVEAPKKADVVGWSVLLIDHLASGSTNEQLRSYCKRLARETWDYVNKLTHAKNSGIFDAEIGTAGVSHFLSTITAARKKWAMGPNQRCAECGSYRISTGKCIRCGWGDPNYEEPTPLRDLSPEELAETPCVHSTDISTFMSPDQFS